MNEQEVLAELQNAIDAGDAGAYYGLLEENGVGYGNLARDAAGDQGFFGKL